MRIEKVLGRTGQRRQLDNGEILSMDILDEMLLPIEELLDFQPEIRRENARETFFIRLPVLARSRTR